MAAFEDIPITFSDACFALRAHPTDEALRTHVRELFLTLRKEIPELRTVLLRQHQESCRSFDFSFGDNEPKTLSPSATSPL
jgi:hypothetical protein